MWYLPFVILIILYKSTRRFALRAHASLQVFAFSRCFASLHAHTCCRRKATVGLARPSGVQSASGMRRTYTVINRKKVHEKDFLPATHTSMTLEYLHSEIVFPALFAPVEISAVETQDEHLRCRNIRGNRYIVLITAPYDLDDIRL